MMVMTMMNLSFRFVSIHYYFAVESLAAALDQVVAAEHIVVEDCNCCFRNHRHISAVVAEDDIHHSTHLHHRELML